MTAADRRALELLCSKQYLVRPGSFGAELWGIGKGGGNCSCPFARQAGKVLNRLRWLGYAEWTRPSADFWGWIATPAGRLALVSPPLPETRRARKKHSRCGQTRCEICSPLRCSKAS